MKYAGRMAAIHPPGDAVRDVVAKKRNMDMTTTMPLVVFTPRSYPLLVVPDNHALPSSPTVPRAPPEGGHSTL